MFYESDNNNDKKNKHRRIITIGICSRFYLYILFSGIFKLLSLILIGDNKIYDDGIGLFGFCPILKNYNFMQSIDIYLGYLIFGLIFNHYRKIDKNEENVLKLLGEDKDFDDLVRKMTTIRTNLIVNKPGKISKNLRTKIMLLCLSFVMHIEVKKVLYIQGFQFFNFWTLEIVFILYLMRKYFKMDFYIHHKVSIIFILSTVSATLFVASFLPSNISGEFEGNAYQNINYKLGSYFYCILFIFLFMLLSFFYSYSRTFSKVLMQISFISPYKLIFLFGIAGLIVSLIASIVSYFIDYPDNLKEYFSSLKSVYDEGKHYKFFGEIFLVWPLYAFSNFMEMTFEISTIYYLNPFYVLMTNNVYYIISELISFLLNLSSDGLAIIQFILAELSEFFAISGYMIYLEILELNFCGLNENLRKRIIEKGEKEFKQLKENISEEENDEDNQSADLNNSKNYRIN